MNTLAIALSIIAAVAVAFIAFWTLRDYLGGIGQLVTRGSTSRSTLNDSVAAAGEAVYGKEFGTVKTYSVNVWPKARSLLAQAGMPRPANMEGMVYANCGGTSLVLPATYYRPLWMALRPTQDALELHRSIASGDAKNLLIAGMAVNAWSMPPSPHAPGAVLIAVALPVDVVFNADSKEIREAGCDGGGSRLAVTRPEALRVIQPFQVATPPPNGSDDDDSDDEIRRPGTMRGRESKKDRDDRVKLARVLDGGTTTLVNLWGF